MLVINFITTQRCASAIMMSSCLCVCVCVCVCPTHASIVSKQINSYNSKTIAAIAMTFSVLEGHSLIASLFSAIFRRPIYGASCGTSVELLVIKQKLDSISLCCKSHRCKTAKIKNFVSKFNVQKLTITLTPDSGDVNAIGFCLKFADKI